MKMKILYCLIIFLFFSYNVSGYNDSFHILSKKLEQLNPHILMKIYNSKAAKAKQYGDFMLPDMEASYMLMPGMMGTSSITVSQMIPFPTKIFMKSGYLEKNHAASEEKLKEAKIYVYSILKFNYISAYFINEKIKILKLNKKILDQIESQVAIQVASAKMPTSKLLFIQIEKIKISDEIKRTQAVKNNIIHNMQSLFSDQIKKTEFLDSLENVNIKQYKLENHNLKRKIKQSATYKAADFELDGLRYMRSLKYHQFFPDLMVGSKYDINPGNTSLGDNFQFMVSLSIPLAVFTRTGELTEAENKVNAKEKSVDNLYFTQLREIRNNIENYNKNKTSYNLYEHSLKELVKQNFEEMLANYVSAKNTSSVDFLEAFRKLLDIELMSLKYQVDMEKNIIKIEQILTEKADKLFKPIKD